MFIEGYSPSASWRDHRSAMEAQESMEREVRAERRSVADTPTLSEKIIGQFEEVVGRAAIGAYRAFLKLPSNKQTVEELERLQRAEAAKSFVPRSGPEDVARAEVDKVLTEAQDAAQQAFASVRGTEPYWAFVGEATTKKIKELSARVREMPAEHDDRPFLEETIEMLITHRDGVRAARAARGWSEDGDEEPEA